MDSWFVGVDIAAETATVVWQSAPRQFSAPLVIDQDESGYRTLVRVLTEQAAPDAIRVVMEATSTYWMGLAYYLHAQGLHVSVVNPLQAHHFAQAQLQRSKTDAIDARSLSELARVLQPARWTPPPAICDQLQQRLAQREDLVRTRTSWRNRLHAVRHHPHADPTVVARWEQLLAALDAPIQALEAEIAALLASDHAWSDSARRLLTITGIGTLTAAWLLVATHNFAYCQTPEQAAAFAGLAPHPRDSGTSRRGKRQTGHGGSAPLRGVLYMAAGSALRHNPPVRAFYQRLLDRGKLKKVARVAAARKLLTIAWAVVVKQRTFDPLYGHADLIASIAP